MAKSFRVIGNYFKLKRECCGLSQGDVAEALGYSTAQNISNWERGLASPPLKILKRLVDLYEIPKKEVIEVFLDVTKMELESHLGYSDKVTKKRSL